MAERGAHLTQTKNLQKNFPSFFDAVATDSLTSYDAIHKLVSVSFYLIIIVLLNF